MIDEPIQWWGMQNGIHVLALSGRSGVGGGRPGRGREGAPASVRQPCPYTAGGAGDSQRQGEGSVGVGAVEGRGPGAAVAQLKGGGCTPAPGRVGSGEQQLVVGAALAVLGVQEGGVVAGRRQAGAVSQGGFREPGRSRRASRAELCPDQSTTGQPRPHQGGFQLRDKKFGVG